MQFFLSLHISEVTTNSPELVVIMDGELVQIVCSPDAQKRVGCRLPYP